MDRWRSIGAAVLCLVIFAGAARGEDAGIAEIVAGEFVSLEDVLERMEQLEIALWDNGDSRVYFAAMYRALTVRFSEALESGYFDDPEWTSRFLVTFCDYYRQAFFDYETGHYDRVPRVWQVALDAKNDSRVTVFHHALMSIHAHVNRDLPFAIADVTPGAERSEHYPDYILTHVLILESVNELQAVLAEFDPELGYFDEQMLEVDEILVEQTLTRWRYRAWRRAALLDDTRREDEKQFYTWLLDLITGYHARYLRGQ